MTSLALAALLEAGAVAAVAVASVVLAQWSAARIEGLDIDRARRKKYLDYQLYVLAIPSVLGIILVVFFLDIYLGGLTGIVIPTLYRLGGRSLGLGVISAPAIFTGAAVYLVSKASQDRIRGLTVLPLRWRAARLTLKVGLFLLCTGVLMLVWVAARRSVATLLIAGVGIWLLVIGCECIRPHAVAWWNHYEHATSEIIALLGDDANGRIIYIVPTLSNDNRGGHATGLGRHEAITVTESAVEKLDENVLAALLYHERTHHERGDSRIYALINASMFALAYLLGGWLRFHIGLSVLATIGIVVGLGVMCAVPVLAWHARPAEYAADRGAVEGVGDPEGIVALLRYFERTRSTSLLHHLSTGLAHAFSAHPTPTERIERICDDHE